MTEQRARLDHLNDDDLDQLHDRLEAAEAAIARARAIAPYAQPIYGDRSRGMQMGWDAARAAIRAALDATSPDGAEQRDNAFAIARTLGKVIPQLPNPSDPNDLDQLLAIQAHLADAVAEMTGLTVAVVLDEARQATAPEPEDIGQPDPYTAEGQLYDIRCIADIKSIGTPAVGTYEHGYDTAMRKVMGIIRRDGKPHAAAPEQPDDAEPLELPRDAVQALHDLTAQLLGTQPSEALRLSQRRLDQVITDRDRERGVVTTQQRELETLRNGASDRAAILEETRDILEQAGYPQAHADDWPRLAPAVSALTTDLAKARRRIGELETALDQAHDGNSGLWRAHAESVSQAGELQATVDRVRALAARWKAGLGTDRTYAYKILAALDGAAQPADKPRCVDCGSLAVTYYNYRDAPFCSPCANGDKPTPDNAERMRHETRRRNLSEALNLGTAAPWDAITDRAADLVPTEAALERVHALTSRWRYTDDRKGGPLAELLVALDGTEPGRHVYLSTGCLHGEHGYCQSHTGLSGAKKPASCKVCGARCICPCHTEQPTP